MARNNNKSKKPKRAQRAVTVVQRSVVNRLDEKAREYARLIMDPCAAPLVHPVYPGGDAGFLFRADSFKTFFVSAGTHTSGIFHWVPGYINSANSELLEESSAAPTTSVLLNASTAAPGKTFLAGNARGYRCVAACAKITFPGAESARSGRVHYGHTTAGTLDVGDSVTVDGVAQLLQHYSRTPTDTIEVYWQPGIADTEFNDPSAAASATIRDRKSAITVAVAGLPAGVGMVIHMTAIYEWTPVVNIGLANNNMGKTMSRNSLDDVLDAIKRTGFKFVKHMGMSALNAYAPGVAQTVQQVFGLMPSQSRSRTAQRLLT